MLRRKDITREDICRVVDDPRFLDIVAFGLQHDYIITSDVLDRQLYRRFHGDKQLNAGVKFASPDMSYVDASVILNPNENIPLPTLTEFTDYEEDVELRKEVATLVDKLRQFNDHCDPAWWAIIGQCHWTAMYVVYPIVRLLKPRHPVRLVALKDHTVVTDGEYFYDIIDQVYGLIVCTFKVLRYQFGIVGNSATYHQTSQAS